MTLYLCLHHPSARLCATVPPNMSLPAGKVGGAYNYQSLHNVYVTSHGFWWESHCHSNIDSTNPKYCSGDEKGWFKWGCLCACVRARECSTQQRELEWERRDAKGRRAVWSQDPVCRGTRHQLVSRSALYRMHNAWVWACILRLCRMCVCVPCFYKSDQAGARASSKGTPSSWTCGKRG